jgi:hypothetical protein
MREGKMAFIKEGLIVLIASLDAGMQFFKQEGRLEFVFEGNVKGLSRFACRCGLSNVLFVIAIESLRHRSGTGSDLIKQINSGPDITNKRVHFGFYMQKSQTFSGPSKTHYLKVREPLLSQSFLETFHHL